MGFMMIKNGVYENIDYPWFEPRFFEYEKDGKIIRDFCSEDVGFCLKAKEKGFPVYIDPSIRVRHEKTILL
jgi:GT2 family glycosyltransferase